MLKKSNLGRFLQFSLIGGLGTIVNLAVFVGLSKFYQALGASGDSVLLNFPAERINFRLDHLSISIAFIVANAFNFFLNRATTFKESHTRPVAGSVKFFIIGLVACLVQITVFSMLTRPTFMQLPTSILNETSGLRNPKYWAQIISIAVATPVNFLGNVLWTFREKNSLAFNS
ncbi:GtrA family protein [Corynebacterium aquatimens]|uniref:GtrA family protein n=1 Tax=Corynebacterium aquatimens TaxID=1190508 RepID=UPI00338EB97B